MDFITDLPPSKSHIQVYDLILVVVDKFTKLARYIPVRKTIDMPQLANVFESNIIKDFGCLARIISDRDNLFTSNFWRCVMWYLKVQH